MTAKQEMEKNRKYGPKNVPASFNQKQNDEHDILKTIEKPEVLEFDLS